MNRGGALTYISCPVSLDSKHLDAASDHCIKIAQSFKAGSKYTRAVEYRPSTATNSLVFAIILPNIEWGYDIHKLPFRVKRELSEAMLQEKKIVLLYKRRTDGEWNDYEAIINKRHGTIHGGDGGALEEYISQELQAPKEVTEDQYLDTWQPSPPAKGCSSDRRRLLLLG